MLVPAASRRRRPQGQASELAASLGPHMRCSKNLRTRSEQLHALWGPSRAAQPVVVTAPSQGSSATACTAALALRHTASWPEGLARPAFSNALRSRLHQSAHNFRPQIAVIMWVMSTYLVVLSLDHVLVRPRPLEPDTVGYSVSAGAGRQPGMWLRLLASPPAAATQPRRRCYGGSRLQYCSNWRAAGHKGRALTCCSPRSLLPPQVGMLFALPTLRMLLDVPLGAYMDFLGFTPNMLLVAIAVIIFFSGS